MRTHNDSFAGPDPARLARASALYDSLRDRLGAALSGLEDLVPRSVDVPCRLAPTVVRRRPAILPAG